MASCEAVGGLKAAFSAEQASYLRGKRYNREKGKVGGDRKSSTEKQYVNGRTAKRLASEFKVSHDTIQKDGKFAAAVDTIAATHGEEVRREILQLQVNFPEAGASGG